MLTFFLRCSFIVHVFVTFRLRKQACSVSPMLLLLLLCSLLPCFVFCSVLCCPFFALFLYSVIVFVTFRLREQAFVEAVGPILTMVIGDDFTDDSLPNKALTMAKDICRKKRAYHQKKQARLANSGKSRKTAQAKPKKKKRRQNQTRRQTQKTQVRRRRRSLSLKNFLILRVRRRRRRRRWCRITVCCVASPSGRWRNATLKTTGRAG